MIMIRKLSFFLVLALAFPTFAWSETSAPSLRPKAKTPKKVVSPPISEPIAQEPVEKGFFEMYPIDAETEIGFIQSSGNSDYVNLHAKLTLTQEVELWRNMGQITAFHTRSRSKKTGKSYTTADKYNLKLRGDRDLSERSYLYVLSEYEQNRFSGFAFQSGAGTGLGYQFVDTDHAKFALEIGPGVRFDKIQYQNAELDPTIRVGQILSWKLNQQASINQTLNAEVGDKNTISRFTLDIRSALSETLDLKVGTEMKHTDKVPKGRQHDDQITYAAIVYRF